MSGYTESWLKFEEGLGTRPGFSGSVEEMRAQHAGVMAALAPQYPPNPESIKTYDGTHGNFGYRVYRPTAATGSGHPVGVYYHPGGLAIGPAIADEYFCAAVAANNNTIIIAIRYRLSPENKAPAHLEDALKGRRWLISPQAHQHANEFGGDASRMYAIGVSAGAGLSVSLTRNILLGQSALSPGTVKGVVAFCPVVLHPDNIPKTYKATHTSSTEHKDNVPLVDGTTLRGFLDLAGLDPEDSDYFPALDTKSLKDFPPTYVATCEMDSLRDDGKVLADSLKSVGVSVKTDHYSGLPHCFWIVPSLPETEVFMKNTFEGVAWTIDQM
ncbi:sterigmatocystin biosynthesis lipase esterase STCI [Fusarium albosuccineum]|uniref:Sterigmatocystin biosynthesis lipase esterase STCI n=1 Tax=Fusarium albosuccineum TaxID=1237068 RepID=A0A8H4LB15_9HYPO|nr:sterigmatocystin biosynthesis lipase esterase STCI [Fusarium albosuccineum]